jgi:hypothetical protein
MFAPEVQQASQYAPTTIISASLGLAPLDFS